MEYTTLGRTGVEVHQDHVHAPIVGLSSIEQLEEAVEAVELSLSDSDSDLAYLEESYQPKPITGHS